MSQRKPLAGKPRVAWAFRLAIGALALVVLTALGPTADSKPGVLEGLVTDGVTGHPLAAAIVSVQGFGSPAITTVHGRFRIEGVPAGVWRVRCRADGYETTVRGGVEILSGRTVTVNFPLHPVGVGSSAAVEESEPIVELQKPSASPERHSSLMQRMVPKPMTVRGDIAPPRFNTESYDPIDEHPFRSALDTPLSTFAIDVDTASYSNTRRFLEREHRLPPIDAVRIEELINYFSYDYPDPGDGRPFSVATEVSVAPWNMQHRLVHIGLQGRRVATADLPPNNLVFLLDVSGSMNSPAKLPLLKAAFRLLVENLRSEDRLAIVVYAGAAGVVLPPTSGDNKDAIFRALDGLSAGGSTAGGEGLRLAYEVARANFDPDANNRVILATDGDFNIGPSSDGEMVRLIESRRDDGIFLSVLGFGTGNYKDSKMEKLADHGNGVASYIDSILEAKKVLVSEMGGTLLTIAKDVKIQVEFNPARVKGYRLIGYENRRLADQDFSDDTKDAGELGAGHSVTVLYEIVPAGSNEKLAGIDELEYQTSRLTSKANRSGELLTLKLRYKEPASDTSELLSQALLDRQLPLASTSEDFRFAAAVAEFGMLLRGSELRGSASYHSVLERARSAMGTDSGGYRAEFVELAERARLLAGESSAS